MSAIARSTHFPKKRRGFALLITITLVAFLVLVLVALATLTRVETQVASNGQQLNQARQNALMALNIALGELQKYAGPDQRVTTTADITATTDKTGAATATPIFPTDSPRVAVQPGARYWTGVWGNNQSNIRYQLRPNQIPPTSGNRRGVTPALLNWLVSGNESASYSTNGSLGGVAPGTGFSYSPASTVNLTDPANPTIAGNPAVLLVGANSVGTGTNATQNYVAAPLVNITAPAGAQPGMGSTATPVIGRYAWWVGDEGVKARINLQNGYQKSGQASDQINSFITSQRSGVEFMDLEPAGTASATPIGADYDFTKTGISNIVTGKQLQLVGDNPAARTRLTTASQNRFHDITTRSYGVLSDTYAGGLKKDLTADIADTSGNFSYRPTDDTPIFTPISTTEENLPTWKHLRSWAQTSPDSSALIDPESTEAKAAGIAPVVLFAGMGMNYYLDALQGIAPNQTRRFKMALYPIVVLYNPYSWPIKATDYDVAIRFGNYSGDTAGIEPHNTFVIQTKKTADTTYTSLAYMDMSSVSIHATNVLAANLTKSFFRLRLSAKDQSGAPKDILPGERYAYMLTTAAINEYSHSNPPELRRVDAISDNTTNYFTLTSAPLSGLEDDTDHILLSGSDGASNNSGTTTNSLRYMETSVALAKKDALASPDWTTYNPADFHFSILNMYQIIRAGIGYRQFCKLDADPPEEPISNRVIPFSPKAKTALRIVAVNEGRIYWSSIYRAGFAYGMARDRYVADTNIRAPYIAGTALESSNSGNVMDTRLTARPFGSTIHGGSDDGGLTLFPGPSMQNNSFSIGFQDPAMGVGLRAILFDLLETPDRLLSMGQLQHVPWARYSFHTSYPFANSYAPLRIQRDLTYRTAQIRRPGEMLQSGTAASGKDALYDLSWHLNRALWDKYFISGVPSNLPDTQTALPNARMTYYHPDNTSIPLSSVKYTGGATNPAYDKAAANLLVSGSFNINSTSEQAWRAILSGSKGLTTNSAYADAADGVETAIPYPRFSRNMTGIASTADGPYAALSSTMKLAGSDARTMMQTTNRGLYLNSPGQTGNTSPESVVNELARSIVNEIRTRGPFMSLADFINRPLTSSTEPAGIKGALAAGLDNMDPAVAQVNPDSLATATGGLQAPITSSNIVVTEYKWDPDHLISKSSSGRSSILTTRWAMSPLQITQADLLSSIGPMLSARSDTFTIRTYGETRNPATSDVNSRAWCEAVVQRVPDYIGGESAETAPADLTTSSSQTFGRQFKVISFRWLSPDEI